MANSGAQRNSLFDIDETKDDSPWDFKHCRVITHKVSRLLLLARHKGTTISPLAMLCDVASDMTSKDLRGLLENCVRIWRSNAVGHTSL